MKTLTITLLALVNAFVSLPTLAPCITEDQTTPCYWDASARSNGNGLSFIVTANNTIIYLPTHTN